MSQLYTSSQQGGDAGSSTLDLFGSEIFVSGDR